VPVLPEKSRPGIIWINHDYLWRFVGPPSLGLIWINFVHLLFSVLMATRSLATIAVGRFRKCISPVAPRRPI
jgi:hypothetical protein